MLVVKAATEDGQLVTLYLENDWNFSKLNELIRDQLNIPVPNQRLFLDGNLLSGNYSLISDSGLKNGDVLLVKSDFGGLDYSALVEPDLSTVSDEVLVQRVNELMEECKPGSMALNTLKFHNEELHEALVARNRDQVFNLVKKEYEDTKKKELEHRRNLMKAYLDPLNPESQSLIHKEIEKNRINENLISAQNYLPESFGKIVMLYIKVEINNVPVKALVDTGAQNTIMSKNCAAKCNLLALVDERFKAVAVGVGAMKTLGKIHLADMKIGSVFIPVSFIVLDEANLEFILGLDVLRRYTCDINLKKNYLGINDVTVPFLSEAEVANFNSYSDTKGHGESTSSTAASSTVNAPASATSVSSASHPGTVPASNAQLGMNEKVKRLSELFNITPEYAKQLLEIAGGDEELAASFVAE